ncbi:phage tail protein [Photorhabdus luminescens]|uniref:phage tail protein n=1 Tax=Photorhabdus luminescens TaxID=29488 RepID=UPI0020CC0276|nr:phage tail protein [Photorhabdus luminescens]
MNHKNDFKAFSINNNANVVSQERYEESQSLKTGFPPDNITVHLLNKVLRQSSTIASVVSNFIATYSGNDVLDDGDIVKLAAQLNRALEQKIATEVPNASLTQKGVVQLTEVVGNGNTLAATQKLVSDVNNNANSRLSKNQNGADVPNKNEFVKNLGLLGTVNLAKSAVPNNRRINGKPLTGDVSLNAGDVGSYAKSESDSKYQPLGNYQPTGNYAVKGESYTKEESDGRYQMRGTTQRWKKIGDFGGVAAVKEILLSENCLGKYLFVQRHNIGDNTVTGFLVPPVPGIRFCVPMGANGYWDFIVSSDGKRLNMINSEYGRASGVYMID